MQKVFLVSVLFSLLLSSCGTLEIYVETTPEGEPALPVASATVEPRLSLDSTSDEIRLAMLKSATQWKSIWMDGTVTYYAMPQTDSLTFTTREQVWIDLTTNRFRVLSGPVDGAAEQFLTSDGQTILRMDLKTGQSQSSPMPDLGDVHQFVPTAQPGYAYPQPLWAQMGTPLSQLAFTSDLAQSEGTFKPIGTEAIAGREALIVEWTYAQGDLPSTRLWLDRKTAVILKMQGFDKGGGDSIRSEAVLSSVRFDDVFASSLFGIPSFLPQFSDVSGQAVEAVATSGPIPSGRDAFGELYFFELPHHTSEVVRFVRMPGRCAVGEADCPQVEAVNAPFPFSFTLPQLAWSPDGNYAALAYPDNPNGTPYKLWLFDPAAGTWTSLWEYAYIDPPMWSPEGDWIAFRQQDGLGGEDLMVIRPDGSNPKDLTASNALPAKGRPYVMDGWITRSILVRSSKMDSNGGTYLVRVADGNVQPLFVSLLPKMTLVPSQDGARIAYDYYDNFSAKHSLQVAEPDGANAVELASFTGGSLFPIVWSPDNRLVAFVYYSESAQGAQIADVYVIDRDGKRLKQVYKGSVIGEILFSPDGRYLLVNDTASPTGGRLFVVNLETLAQRLIQSPGLTLDADWILPSWRK